MACLADNGEPEADSWADPLPISRCLRSVVYTSRVSFNGSISLTSATVAEEKEKKKMEKEWKLVQMKWQREGEEKGELFYNWKGFIVHLRQGGGIADGGEE